MMEKRKEAKTRDDYLRTATAKKAGVGEESNKEGKTEIQKDGRRRKDGQKEGSADRRKRRQGKTKNRGLKVQFLRSGA